MYKYDMIWFGEEWKCHGKMNENRSDHVFSDDHGIPLLIYRDGSDMMSTLV